MIGAIVLTMRPPRANVKRQDIAKQNARTKESGLAVIEVKSGQALPEKAEV
jgi:NADH-quinone oxidoreductase subunit J